MTTHPETPLGQTIQKSKNSPQIFSLVRRLILLFSQRALNIIHLFTHSFIKYLKKIIYYSLSPKEDMFPFLEDLVYSGNKRIIAFTRVLHKHDKITDYNKVFDSITLCLLFLLMFMPVLRDTQKRSYSPIFTLGVLGLRELSECPWSLLSDGARSRTQGHGTFLLYCVFLEVFGLFGMLFGGGISHPSHPRASELFFIMS